MCIVWLICINCNNSTSNKHLSGINEVNVSTIKSIDLIKENVILFFFNSIKSDSIYNNTNSDIIIKTNDLRDSFTTNHLLDLNLNEIDTASLQRILNYSNGDQYATLISLNHLFCIENPNNLTNRRVQIGMYFIEINEINKLCLIYTYINITPEWGVREIQKLRFNEEMTFEMIERRIISIS